MQVGIDSFAAAHTDDSLEAGSVQRMSELIDQIVYADEVGLDSFGIGEHHRKEFLDSAHPIILGAAAVRTHQIRLTSAVSVLSAIDPVRLYQQFATVDILSNGRAEIIAGRGSFTDAFPLFGLQLENYDALFEDHLDLLLALQKQEYVTWSGQFRPPLTGQGVFPRPIQNPLPVWIGVGGTAKSFARAGALGLPLMVAIIGGETRRFRPLIDLYYETAERFGHPRESLKVGVHSLGYIAPSKKEAADDFFPGYAKAVESVAKERGWGPITRERFDAQLGKEGAMLIGEPEEVTEKILRHSESLGGIARITFQMNASSLPHAKVMRAIEMLGTHVAPQLRSE